MREALLIGAAPGDGTGDPARTGSQKVNDNFAELYTFLGGDSLPTQLSTLAFSGDVADATGTLAVGQGGTGSTTLTAGSVLLGNGSGALSSFASTAGRLVIGNGGSGLTDDANLTWDGTAKKLKLGGPSYTTTGVALVAKAADDAGNGIASFLTNNETAGLEFRYTGLYAIGTDTDIPIEIISKGAGRIKISSPSGFVQFGQVYFTGDTLNVDTTLNSDNEILYVNYYGYNNGPTRYRDLLICDGRTHGVLHVVGAATPIFRPETAELVALGTSGTQFSDLYLGNGTNTTAGVSATINKATGRFRLSSGSTSFTLTNSHISAGDTVICQPCQNDATGTVKNVVPAGGSAVINFVAPTSDMDVQFQVIRN